jgi:3',5'-cyclic-AMP phosphodiesterase
MSPASALVQLSDPHIGALWNGVDPAARLEATVTAVRQLRPQPDAVLLSGDLAENATDAEYSRLRELLAPIEAPVCVLPGNHDDRGALRRHFDLDGAGDEPIQYELEVGGVRLVVVDTKRNGSDGGELGAQRLRWLDSALGAKPAVTTVVAMHHPPLVTGIRPMDAIGLPAADRAGLEAVVAAHPQVQLLVGGHVHRAIAGEFAGRAVLAAPSTYLQLELDFQATDLRFGTDPPGFAVHLFMDGELISHVRSVGYRVDGLT